MSKEKRAGLKMEGDPLLLLPNEMQREIISRLPANSILNARFVSSQWKAMITRNFSDFTCHVSDDTYPLLANTTEIFRTVKMFDLTGKDRKIISSTRGAGRIIGNAKCLELVGNNIEEGVLDRILHYGAESLEELMFKRCRASILISVLASGKHSFLNLTRLTVYFNECQYPEQTLFLNKLASVSEPSFRVLYHFNLTWTCCKLSIRGSPETIFFENYLAIFRAVIRVRRTLKSLEITREPSASLVLLSSDLINFNANAIQLNLIKQFIGELKEVKLSKLKLSLIPIEGQSPWFFERELLSNQSSLKEIILDKKFFARPPFLPQTMPNLLPTNPTLLTSINLSLSVEGGNPISLGYLSKCTNLKSLEIVCYYNSHFELPRNGWICSVSEIHDLPKTLEKLRLIEQRQIADVDQDETSMFLRNFYRESYLILNENQLEWIVKNLQNLKTLGCCLIATGQPGGRQAPARNINPVIPNVNLELFKELVGMPQMKNMEFNMVNVGQLRWIRGVWRPRTADPLCRYIAGIQEYLDFCKQEAGINLATKVIRKKCVEVTITK